jgi:hypothetical protein
MAHLDLRKADNASIPSFGSPEGRAATSITTIQTPIGFTITPGGQLVRFSDTAKALELLLRAHLNFRKVGIIVWELRSWGRWWIQLCGITAIIRAWAAGGKISKGSALRINSIPTWRKLDARGLFYIMNVHAKTRIRCRTE